MQRFWFWSAHLVSFTKAADALAYQNQVFPVPVQGLRKKSLGIAFYIVARAVITFNPRWRNLLASIAKHYCRIRRCSEANFRRNPDDIRGVLRDRHACRFATLPWWFLISRFHRNYPNIRLKSAARLSKSIQSKTGHRLRLIRVANWDDSSLILDH